MVTHSNLWPHLTPAIYQYLAIIQQPHDVGGYSLYCRFMEVLWWTVTLVEEMTVMADQDILYRDSVELYPCKDFTKYQ